MIRFLCLSVGLLLIIATCRSVTAQVESEGFADSSASRHPDPLYRYRPGHGAPGIVYPKTVTELLQLGEVADRAGELEIARSAYARGLATAREQDDQASAAYASGKLSRICFRLEKHGLAANYHEQAVGMFRTIGNRLGLAEELQLGSQIYLKRKRPDLAIKDLSEAVSLAGKLEDRELAIDVHSDLSSIYLAQADTAGALEHLLKAFSLSDPQEEYDSWEKSGRALQALYQSMDSVTRRIELLDEMNNIKFQLGKVPAHPPPPPVLPMATDSNSGDTTEPRDTP